MAKKYNRKIRERSFNKLQKTEVHGQRVDRFGHPIAFHEFKKENDLGWVIMEDGTALHWKNRDQHESPE